MEEKMKMTYIIAFGDAFDGLSFVGPYDPHEVALADAEKHAGDAEWHVVAVYPIEHIGYGAKDMRN
jgi:hypothetical protein